MAITEAGRIGPQEAHDHLQTGEVLLVCAYDSDEKFEKYRLEGAIALSEFRAKADSIPKDREVIFY